MKGSVKINTKILIQSEKSDECTQNVNQNID